MEVESMGNRRTTLVLDESLYRQAKRVAVEQDKKLKEIFEEALRAFLMGGQQQGRRQVPGPRFGVYPGKPLMDLRRETLYRDIKK
jgi:hypothetical protein